MKNLTNPISQRLVRKGALVEETYNLFGQWIVEESFDENFDRVFFGGFRSEGWKKEVRTTLRRRFRDLKDAKSLIDLAQKNYNILDWKICLHFWVALRETLYGLFLEDWLFPQYKSGRFLLRTDDAVPYVRKAWKSLNTESASLTEYGAVRTARDLLRMARDFRILEGDGPAKKFSSLQLSDDLFLYFCHTIATEEKSTSRVPVSDLWKLLMLDQEQVHDRLLRLHQYRKLDYQVAGSLVQLTLPCTTASEYAERMAA
ncbi:hypothetical protein [Sinorhizobium meliloti]